MSLQAPLRSGTKKEPKPKLLGSDIFLWGAGLPREGGGGQKVRYVPRNQGNQTFWVGYPGFLPGSPRGRPKSLRKKKFVFNFWRPYKSKAAFGLLKSSLKTQSIRKVEDTFFHIFS